MGLEPLHDKWVIVFSGAQALADLRAQELRDAGIPTYVPDAHLKELDAPAVGGDLFHWQVLVPRAEEARARAVIGGA